MIFDHWVYRSTHFDTSLQLAKEKANSKKKRTEKHSEKREGVEQRGETAERVETTICSKCAKKKHQWLIDKIRLEMEEETIKTGRQKGKGSKKCMAVIQ